jgi:hypothetical protein
MLGPAQRDDCRFITDGSLAWPPRFREAPRDSWSNETPARAKVNMLETSMVEFLLLLDVVIHFTDVSCPYPIRWVAVWQSPVMDYSIFPVSVPVRISLYD